MQFYNLSHTGIRATDKLISSRFVWPSMHSDYKILLNGPGMQALPENIKQTFQIPDKRFQVVHLDLIGPLPLSKGYILTMMDRYSCWPEAIP